MGDGCHDPSLDWGLTHRVHPNPAGNITSECDRLTGDVQHQRARIFRSVVLHNDVRTGLQTLLAQVA